MQDVRANAASPDRRSIRNIPVPPDRRHFNPMPEEYVTSNKRGGRGRSFWLWAGAIVVACILLGMLVSTLFSGASVTVYPREATVNPPATFQAMLNAPVGTLAYQLMMVSQSAQRTVAASGQMAVQKTAQGSGTVYNAYNTSSQKLIANTRFEAPDGKIYRIHQSIVVPGGKKNTDGTLTPGSVQATLYADSPGPDYNRGQTKFTIPGFKGDPRYKSFYAESNAITGGFSGTEPGVSPADLQNAQGQMKQELAQGIPSTAAGQVPTGYIAIPGTASIQYGEVSSADAGSGNALLTETATATEAIIRTSDLANAVAKTSVQGYSGEAVDFADPSQIHITLAGTYTSDNPVTLSLSGNPSIIWQFDPAKLQQALAGKNKQDFDGIIKTFAPAIAKATASLRPFWKNTFPTNPSQITVKIGNNS